MEKKFFARANCPICPENYNKGEQVEWKIGFEKTGVPSIRNNRPAESGGDVLDWQVKSPKASVSDNDNCSGYIFGFANADFYYEMSHEEFNKFLGEFGYLDRDSHTNKAKVRIKNDTKKMRKWLEERV